jgi:DMSO/TMAO reductase YedYZ molybdopterin-dependent catalytic subunit
MSGFAVGQGAALAALLAGAAAATLGGGQSPLGAIAAPIMERTPADVANAILQLLGPFAKPFAAWGAAALLLLGGGMLGAALWRLPRSAWPAAPAAVGTLAAGAGLLAAGAADRVSVVAAATAYGLGIAWLARPRGDEAPNTSRRAWLLESARTIGGVAVASLLPLAGATVRSAIGVRPSGPLFAFAPPAARKPGFDLDGLTPEVSPSFYYMSKNVTDPVLNTGLWRLEVDGLVERRLRLSLDDLLGLRRVDRFVAQQCVSNPVGGPLMSAGLFSGVALSELLRMAGAQPAATYLHFESPDGHHEGIGLDEAISPGTLIAYGLNGELLPWAHGYPARALIPGLYGFRSVKWLTRLELLPRPRSGHWAQRGWTAAAVQPTARIDLARMTEAGLLVAGVAFAGRAGVGGVEVRLDGGPWRAAELHAPPLSDVMWVQWRALLPPRAEALLVEARMIDGSGRPQEEAVRGQFPNGATGLHLARISA